MDVEPTANGKAVILLTATVDPKGTAWTRLQDPGIRKAQYLYAIDFYLRETDCDIVFCENTGADIFDEIESAEKYKRLEYLTFDGNDYDKCRGKGYGEAIIIRYAIENSLRIRNSDLVIKITGRVIIRNLNELLHVMSRNSELKMPYAIFEFAGAGLTKTVCFCAPKEWLLYTVKKYQELIYDVGYSFEKVICRSVTETSDMKVIPFFPHIDGICGGFNRPYVNLPMPDRKLNHFNGLYHLYELRGDMPKYIVAKICWLCYVAVRKICFFKSCLWGGTATLPEKF